MIPVITGGENERFVRLCIQNNVDLLLIGGAAVAHYGCREGTGIAEIDLMVDPSPLNADRLMAVLTPLLDEADLTAQFTAEQLQRHKMRLPLKDRRQSYNLDILTPWEEWS